MLVLLLPWRPPRPSHGRIGSLRTLRVTVRKVTNCVQRSEVVERQREREAMTDIGVLM